MFAESSTIHPRSNPASKNVSCVRVPNYSSKVELVHCREKSTYGSLSQRVISNRVKRNISDILERAGRKLLLLYVKVKFLFWYNLINRDWVRHKSWYKRFYPKLISDGVTPLWAHRKGLQIVVPYFLEIYRKQTRRAMRQWKLYVYEIRLLIIRMFNKWLVKASRWKLNRLNAARFLQLTRPWGNRIKKSLRRYWWPIFKYQCDLVLIRRHVRLLFRCWRTVTTAMIRGRRLVKHRTLVLLRENLSDERNRQEAMRLACAAIAARHAAQRAWRNWERAFRARRLIKRVLWAYCEEHLRKAWRSWAYSEYTLPKPRPPSPRKLPPPAPLPVPEPVSAYKRRGSRLPRVPPHIVVPLMGLHSYALVHSPGATARDRMEFRIHRAERIAEKVEHHIGEHKAAHPELLENTPVSNSKLFDRSWQDVTSSGLRGSAVSQAHSVGRSVSAGKPPRPNTATKSSTAAKQNRGRSIYGGVAGGSIGGAGGSAAKSHLLKTPVRSASPQLSKQTPSRAPSSNRGVVDGAGGTGGGLSSARPVSRGKPPLSARKKLP